MPNSGGPVVGRDPGGDQVLGLDRDTEGRAVAAGVVHDHGLDLELVQTAGHQRRADEASGVARHEHDVLGGDELCCDAEVALVLAVFVVDHDHELAVLVVGDRLRYGGQRHQVCPSGLRWPSNRSTYLATTSISRFTSVPGT